MAIWILFLIIATCLILDKFIGYCSIATAKAPKTCASCRHWDACPSEEVRMKIEPKCPQWEYKKKEEKK